jgi:enoyl-CoA hydratase/carnithine racemase
MPLTETTQAVRYEVASGIATITLNRPAQGNSIDRAVSEGMQEAWRDVRENPDVRVAIIAAAGERHFCTGAAVSGLNTSDAGVGLVNGRLQDVVRLSALQNNVWKPVICVVNGLCAGGGLHFVVDADIVIASENAAFMDTHVNVGQVGAIENIGLARRMTLGGALLLTLAGRSHRMPASRAHQLGLVDLLEPTPAEATARARTLAAAIALNSPQAMSLSKQAIWQSMQQGYSEAMEYGWNLLKLQWNHPDFEEGPKAFAEKRSPEWNPDPNARR